MEISETINQSVMEEEIYLDIERHLEEVVIRRVLRLENELKGKHIYSFNIILTPQRINYHKFNFENLNNISRQLINGMVSLGTIPNRKFWNKYFTGGIRTLSINQGTIDDFPSFCINFLLFSNIDNLDGRITSQLSTRLKMIDSSLTCKLEYLGLYEISLVKENLNFSTNFHLESSSVQKLGQKNIDSMVKNPFQRPRFVGCLFKSQDRSLNGC